jgi:hypothetical protein
MHDDAMAGVRTFRVQRLLKTQRPDVAALDDAARAVAACEA